MSDYLSEFLVALSAVFFVVDPPGVVPIFLAMTRGDSPEKIRSMAKRACLVGGLLLVFFALFGAFLFQVLGVTMGAFRIAGGILLLITALDMIRAKPAATRTSPEETAEGLAKEDIALVPLAIPLLAGPGAIATVMVLMARGKTPLHAVPVLIAIALTFVGSYLLLRGASVVQKVLGASGLLVLERVMGLILAAISVQFVADGMKDLVQAAI
ncbi:MAG: MarC family protein [Myxococcota bacterium]|nr:MarC family protein [Myxococcota bacterium]